VHRLSHELAQRAFEYLQGGGTGHHECVLATLCQSVPSCKMAQIAHSWIGKVHYRPAISPKSLASAKKNKLYHPVKSVKSQGKLNALAKKYAKAHKGIWKNKTWTSHYHNNNAVHHGKGGRARKKKRKGKH
jgi:hypothetical protein